MTMFGSTSQKRHLARAFAMKHPELRGAVRRHVEHLRDVQADIAGPARQYRSVTLGAR